MKKSNLVRFLRNILILAVLALLLFAQLSACFGPWQIKGIRLYVIAAAVTAISFLVLLGTCRFDTNRVIRRGALTLYCIAAVLQFLLLIGTGFETLPLMGFVLDIAGAVLSYKLQTT